MLALLRTRRFAPLFVTQLLGALNDNLLKAALVVTVTVGAAPAGLSVPALVNLCSALLILPFFLFSALAGQLADRMEKARLIRAIKIVEVAVMLLAALGFHLHQLPLLLTALFLMGTHSAFFGPLKYAVLPQHLAPRELVGGNALVETGTFLAILIGTLLGGILIALEGIGIGVTSAVLVAVAALGWLASRAIPEAPASSAARERIDWNLARSTRDVLRRARANRPAFQAILGASWFWFLGALLLAHLPLIATTAIGGDERTITLLLAIFSVGIGIGSVSCERLSRSRIELGLVAPASLVVTALLVELALAVAGAHPDGHVPVRIAIDLFALGVAGGAYVVPLYALMQERSAIEERARIVGANNIVNAIFMVAAAGMGVLLSALSVSLAGVLIAAAVLSLIATLVAAVLTRDFLLRVVVGAIVRTIYRVRVEGLEHVPDHGPAILAANHVSYADALVLGALSRRPVRFVMDHRIHDQPLLRWFFRLARAIPIAPRSEDPERLARALDEVDRALGEGEIVGIFPEGKLTRDGDIDTFRPGLERILARRPVPVVPVALRGLWGSIFSHAGGAPLAKWPRRFWSRIEVVFGRALAPAGVSAKSLEAHVALLRGGRR